MDLWYLLVVACAMQRVTAVWLAPIGILAPIRLTLAQYDGWLRFGVNCPLCISTWFAAILFALWHLHPIGQAINCILAIGAIGSIINAITKGT